MSGDLETLLSDGLIDEVLGRLKTGKEAEVWLVRHGDEVLAAKIYKERHVRSFKNNAGYKEGRQVRNTRTQRAIARGSKFGRESEEDAWKSAEADALYKLRAQGVRVPEPKAFYDGVLLMQLVVDGEGQPAPRLIDAHLTPEEAAAAYADLRAQVVAMLCAELIHGDLSPYNVLLGAAGPTIIDFPQVVGAAHNNLAESFFRRDLENLRTHFAAIDPALAARASDAAEIWAAYVRRELTPDFVPTGRAPPAPQRQEREGGHERRRPGGPQPAHGQGRPHAPHGQGRPQPGHGQGRPQPAHGQGRPQPAHGQGRPQPAHGQGRPQPAHGQGRPQPAHGQGRPQPAHGQGRARGDGQRAPDRGPAQREARFAQGQPSGQGRAPNPFRHGRHGGGRGQAPRNPGNGSAAPPTTSGRPHPRGAPPQAGRRAFPDRPGARPPPRQGQPGPIVERVQRTSPPAAPRQAEPRANEGEARAQPRPAEDAPAGPRREE